MEGVKEVDDTFTELILQVELFALRNLLSALQKISRAFIDILKEILSCCLQEQDLIIMVTMVWQITAFFAYKFVVQAAVGHVCSTMVWTEILFETSSRILLVGLRLLVNVELMLWKGRGRYLLCLIIYIILMVPLVAIFLHCIIKLILTTKLKSVCILLFELMLLVVLLLLLLMQL